MPVLWLHPGLTIPRPDERRRLADLEDAIIRAIHLYRVAHVALERPGTWTGVSLDDFPRLDRLVGTRTYARTR